MNHKHIIRTIRPSFLVFLLTCLIYSSLGYQMVHAVMGPAPSISLSPTLSPTVSPTLPETAAANSDAAAWKEDWNLILVNSSHPLPETYQVSLTQLRNGQQVDDRIYPALQEMLDDARAEGLSPLICSSYRTRTQQQVLYDKKVQYYLADGYTINKAEELAAQWVAAPGTSEHETGLAVDIVAESYQSLDDAQADTAEQQWLLEHCWEYGFILRYPEDKTDLTGVAYEPWHYRYVGVAVAQAMEESGQCLEEYLDAAD